MIKYEKKKQNMVYQEKKSIGYLTKINSNIQTNNFLEHQLGNNSASYISS